MLKLNNITPIKNNQPEIFTIRDSLEFEFELDNKNSPSIIITMAYIWLYFNAVIIWIKLCSDTFDFKTCSA